MIIDQYYYNNYQSKFMWGQIIAHRQDNQALKFGQLIERNVRNIFLQILCKYYALGRLAPNLFLFI